jgi:hypothetical protein
MTRTSSRSGEFRGVYSRLSTRGLRPWSLLLSGTHCAEAKPRHHVYAKTSHKDVQLAEVGPRFEAKRKFICSSSSFPRSLAAYEIRQGTIDQTEADVEWLLRPYMRTSKKRNQL